MFPSEKDPVGGEDDWQIVHDYQLTLLLDPSNWADSELKRWLEVVRALFHI